MTEKYGFVYVWYNRWKKKFYVGCHWGREDDGYVCSSKLMREAYKRNPEYFKRRIVQRVYTNRLDLLTEEHKWLALISDDELGNRYYNLSKKHFGHWSTSEEKRLTVAEKRSLKLKGRPLSEETKRKMSEARRGKPRSAEFKAAMSLRQKGVKRKKHTEETREKMSLSHTGKKFSEDTRAKMAISASNQPRFNGRFAKAPQ